MSENVVEIDIALPPKGSTGMGGALPYRRPRAEVRFSLENGDVRSGWVPPRVARLYEKALPDLPCTYRSAMDALMELESRVCFTALTEMQSRREHSSHEVRSKLQQHGFRVTSIDAAIERALDLKFLDDARFMASFIDERLRRGWGRRKIELELKRRGVDPRALPGYPEAFFSAEDDAERARQLLQRKSVPETRAFEKLVRHLVGKGFSFDVAARAARERIDDDA